jgi:menaquinone-9 beta-reductase
MTATTYDAAVIGGGLAGCSAAIHLARQGARVALFEAKTYPHHKVCGEFLSPECLSLLDELGAMPAIQEAAPRSIHTVHISAPDGTAWKTELPGVALGLSRYRLDHLLAQTAQVCDVALFESTTVNNLEGNLGQGFQVEARTGSGRVDVSARAVIGAHGKRSSLDRGLKRTFLQQSQPFVALKVHLDAPPMPGRIELHGFPGGYCGLSEVEGGRINLCLLAREDVFREAGATIPAFIAWMRAQNPNLEERLRAAQPVTEWYSIAQVPFVDKTALEADILMAGDSAGLIAPLAGDGMSMALQGGKLAALHVGDFLNGRMTASQLRQQYPAVWRREFGGRLRLGRGLQTLMLRPRFLSLGLHAINYVPPLGNFIVQHTRDLSLIES